MQYAALDGAELRINKGHACYGAHVVLAETGLLPTENRHSYCLGGVIASHVSPTQSHALGGRIDE